MALKTIKLLVLVVIICVIGVESVDVHSGTSGSKDSVSHDKKDGSHNKSKPKYNESGSKNKGKDKVSPTSPVASPFYFNDKGKGKGTGKGNTSSDGKGKGYGKGKGKGSPTWPVASPLYYDDKGKGKGKEKFYTSSNSKGKGKGKGYTSSDGKGKGSPSWPVASPFYYEGKGKGKGKGYYDFHPKLGMNITITNLAFQQPLSSFFVMVHNAEAPPLFIFGRAPSDELAVLAENGDPSELERYYKGRVGVYSSEVFIIEPYFVGQPPPLIRVNVTQKYPYVTIASMALNTNDCFIAVNAEMLEPGDEIFLPGLDAGSEENNELCSSMPGPACIDIDTSNENSGNGEGVVHVHRGFHGVGDLDEEDYDWRNPMAIVRVSKRYKIYKH